MKELLEIFNANELSVECRIKIMRKMVNVLNSQVGANLYEDIVEELCNALQTKGGEND